MLVREIMYCKPGKVRPLVEKFTAMNKLGAKMGMPKMRIMTDFCAERYWTVVVGDGSAGPRGVREVHGQSAGLGGGHEEARGDHEGLPRSRGRGKREIYKIEA